MKDVYILSATRTPIGSFQGELSKFTATELGGISIKESLKRSTVNPTNVELCAMGNVLTAGIGQGPARQSAIYAGIPMSAETFTINKLCGSGLKAILLATQAIQLEDITTAVAGGMESMSNVPYLLPKARSGYRLGNGEVIDSVMHDGLVDKYQGVAMGVFAEKCAKKYTLTREMQDNYAQMSYERAIAATKEGRFKDEIVGVVNGDKTIFEDEEPKRYNLEKGKKLKPAFEKEGSVTAFNASKINDGASSMVLTSTDGLKIHNAKPLAKIVAYSSFAQEPSWFTTAPIFAITTLLQRANLTINDIDLFEINEAFAVVSMVAQKELHIPMEKLNVNGGAVALGHPIGASGSRILTTLLYALKQRNLKRGIASICIGGGEATAMMVEIV